MQRNVIYELQFRYLFYAEPGNFSRRRGQVVMPSRTGSLGNNLHRNSLVPHDETLAQEIDHLAEPALYTFADEYSN